MAQPVPRKLVSLLFLFLWGKNRYEKVNLNSPSLISLPLFVIADHSWRLTRARDEVPRRRGLLRRRARGAPPFPPHTSSLPPLFSSRASDVDLGTPAAAASAAANSCPDPFSPPSTLAPPRPGSALPAGCHQQDPRLPCHQEPGRQGGPGGREEGRLFFFCRTAFLAFFLSGGLAASHAGRLPPPCASL